MSFFGFLLWIEILKIRNWEIESLFGNNYFMTRITSRILSSPPIINVVFFEFSLVDIYISSTASKYWNLKNEKLRAGNGYFMTLPES